MRLVTAWTKATFEIQTIRRVRRGLRPTTSPSNTPTARVDWSFSVRHSSAPNVTAGWETQLPQRPSCRSASTTCRLLFDFCVLEDKNWYKVHFYSALVGAYAASAVTDSIGIQCGRVSRLTFQTTHNRGRFLQAYQQCQSTGGQGRSSISRSRTNSSSHTALHTVVCHFQWCPCKFMDCYSFTTP